MPTGGARSDLVGENLAQALLQVNKLLYKTPPSLSVATTRRLVSGYPQQRSYSNGETLVFSFPTGSQFVDMANSFLRIKLNTTAASKGGLGRGSIANVFSEVRVKSRSGTEISRLQGFNVFTHAKDRWTCSEDDFKSYKSAQGYGNLQLQTAGTSVPAQDNAGVVLSATAGVDYILPLCSIPCFDPLGGCLLPPQLLDGMILEMDIEAPATAIHGTATLPASLTLSKLEFRLCAFTLGDAERKRVV